MPKKVAILLNGSICNDYRVIKTIESLGRENEIHLFYINGDVSSDIKLFKSNVSVFPIPHPCTLWNKIVKHSFFCFEFNHFYDQVINKGIQYNYVWANDLPTLFPAFKIAKKLQAKLVYDSHEIYLETLNQFFPKKTTLGKSIVFSVIKKFMKFHGKFIERKFITKTDMFITVNNSLLQYFKRNYNFSNSEIIMNLPRVEDNTTKKIDYRKKYNWKDLDIITLYQGQLNEGRGLFLLIEAILLLENNVKLVIIGDGPIKVSLSEFVQKVGKSNQVKFIETIALKELPDYTKGADIGINLLEDINLSKKFASPNKLFEYIHSNIPVLASNTIENRLVFEKYSIGILCENSPSSIADSIRKFGKSDLEKFKENCSSAIKEYSWEKQEDILKSIIK